MGSAESRAFTLRVPWDSLCPREVPYGVEPCSPAHINGVTVPRGVPLKPHTLEIARKVLELRRVRGY